MQLEPGAFVIGGIAALAVMVLVIGFARGASDLEVDQRIERYGKRKVDEPKAATVDLTAAVLSPGRALTSLNRLVEQRNFGANLARDLARADLRLRVSEWLVVWAGFVAGPPAILLLFSLAVPALRSPVALLIAAAVGFVLPSYWLRRRQRRRLAAFEEQLADTITLVANSLRAGSSFLQACQLVSQETTPPMSTEFARLVREVGFGVTMEQSLENMVRRVKSDDLDLMTTAVAIQIEVGGNLAEVLDTIAFTIRERVRIKGEIRALTAQQRLSGLVVGLLPFGLGAFLFILFPKFLAPLFESPPSVLGMPAGVILLAFGGVMMLIGFSAIRRIVDIDV